MGSGSFESPTKHVTLLEILNAKTPRRFNIPILRPPGQRVLAMGVILGIAFSLYWLVVLIITLLVSASQNAWTLLVQSDRNPVNNRKII